MTQAKTRSGSLATTVQVVSHVPMSAYWFRPTKWVLSIQVAS